MENETDIAFIGIVLGGLAFGLFLLTANAIHWVFG